MENRFNHGNTGQFYFLHIPKTAGTTVTSYLRDQFHEADILPVQTWNMLYDFTNKLEKDWSSEEFLKSHKLITGHYGYGITSSIPSSEVITILRDPVQRTISQLCHIVKDPTFNNWVNPYFIRVYENIETIITQPKRLAFFENYQARYLAKALDFPSMVAKSGYKGQDLLFDSAIAFQKREEPNHLLDQAKKHADSFLLVGVQDYVEEALILLSHKKGWQLPKNIKREMKATNTELVKSLQEHHFEMIEEISQTDRRLYAYYKARFEMDYLSFVSSVLPSSPKSWDEFLTERSLWNTKIREALRGRDQ